MSKNAAARSLKPRHSRGFEPRHTIRDKRRKKEAQWAIKVYPKVATIFLPIKKIDRRINVQIILK